LAKKGTLPARRRAIAQLGNRDIVEYEDGQAVRKGTVIGKLFSELGPRYLDRPGGYTRIIRLSLRRLGDNGQLVLLQLIGADESEKKHARKRRSRKKAKDAVETAEVAEVAEIAEEQATDEAEEIDQAEQAAESEESKDQTGQTQ